MTVGPLPIRLLERFLPSLTADAVVGDLIERDVHGMRLWRETLVAIWHLREPNFETGGTHVVLLVRPSSCRAAARSRPDVRVTAILTLGIAIGATTAIFSVANPVLIESLPYRNADRVMVVWERDRDGSRSNVGFTTFRDYTDRATTFESDSGVRRLAADAVRG